MGQPLWDAHEPLLTNVLTFGLYLFVDGLEKHVLASASFNQNWKIFYGGLKGSCQIWFLYSPNKRFFMSSIKILDLFTAILFKVFLHKNIAVFHTGLYVKRNIFSFAVDFSLPGCMISFTYLYWVALLIETSLVLFWDCFQILMTVHILKILFYSWYMWAKGSEC